MVSTKSEKRFDDFFREKGITILEIPKTSLRPGTVYESEVDDVHLHYIGTVNDIVVNKNNINQAITPDVIDQPLESDYRGVIEFNSDTELKVNFFKGIWGIIKKAINLDASVQIDSNRVNAAIYSIKSISQEQISSAQLENELVDSYKMRDNYRKRYGKYIFYLASDIFYCDQLDVSNASLSADEAKALVNAADLAEVKFGMSRGEKGMHTFSFHKRIIFGVKLVKLDFNPYTGEDIALQPIRTDAEITVVGLSEYPQDDLPKPMPMAIIEDDSD